MTSRVIINGAKGKMGQLAIRALSSCDEFELVAELGREHDLQKEIQTHQAEIVIDLTRADSVYQNAITIIKNGAHPVIGTSGLLEDEIKELQKQCEDLNLGGLIVPNFSIGAVLMMQFAEKAARWLSEVEIIETHHQNKLDAPSGTALKTAQMIANARQVKRQELHLKELVQGARGANYQDVPIHSLRLPGVLARQEVIFGQKGETLTIKHDSIDRCSFSPGIILACQTVKQLNKLVFGLDHFL